MCHHVAGAVCVFFGVLPKLQYIAVLVSCYAYVRDKNGNHMHISKSVAKKTELTVNTQDIQNFHTPGNTHESNVMWVIGSTLGCHNMQTQC